MSEQTRVPFSHDEMRDAAWAATADALAIAQRRVGELEATDTRLREALEVVTGTLVQARFSDISDEEYDAAIASSSAALAQDAEQGPIPGSTFLPPDAPTPEPGKLIGGYSAPDAEQENA